MSFRAYFDGRCDDCGLPIDKGDEVEYVAGQFADELVHLRCVASPLEIGIRETVCTECFIIKPCDCP